jgi:hypothetical protein
VKLYSVDSTGHIDRDPATSTGAAVSGTSATNGHPWQCSMVMTLVAGARGKGRFGRIYLPPQGFTILSDGTVTLVQRDAMFASTKTLLENLSNAPGPDSGFGLVVAGRTGGGTLRDVTEVRMGAVCDTQRRRRRSLGENYAVGSFTP